MRPMVWRLIERFKPFGRPAVVLFNLLLVVMIGYARYWTGPEYAFSAFYLFPLVTTTWVAGLAPGIVLALASALSWLMADLNFMTSFSSMRVPFINETLRLIVFILVVALVWRLKKALCLQQKLARTDSLTGLSNRRAFVEFADLELKRAGRFGLPITLLCLDVDNFKFVNDHYGHHSGDRLLKEVARTIAGNIRAIDLAARLGGDEFWVLFPGANEKNADKIVRKISERLAGTMRENKWPVTFSAGMATFIQIPDNLDEMMKTADALMYRAKKGGKNNLIHQVLPRESKPTKKVDSSPNEYQQ